MPVKWSHIVLPCFFRNFRQILVERELWFYSCFFCWTSGRPRKLHLFSY